MIDLLKSIEPSLSDLLSDRERWKSLDIDYYPPRVERLWTQYDSSHRLFIHVIHPTTSDCLFHKHRWPAAFKMVKGSYEMGISYSVSEISSEEAYKLPIISKFIISEGSYYEMTESNSLHYVRPLYEPSISLMLTGPLYPEASYRTEVLDKELYPLNEFRVKQILEEVKKYYRL